jgi:exopolysaccharide biosynthesis polyprenyl glycosylphosphotransferase
MRQRTRFVLSTLALDLLALLTALLISSRQVYGELWPTQSRLLASQNPRPMLGLLVIGIVLGSWLAMRTVDPALSRPSYGQALLALVVAAGVVAVGSFLLRTYFSRQFVVLTLAIWLVLALLHRALRRVRPWTESMVLVTDEKDLVRDLADAPHADVLQVLEPRGEAPAESLPPNTTLVVDLRTVLGDSMASFVSSSTLAGLEVRPFSQVYEEHTERIPLVHLAEGWEISVPLGRRAFYAPFKRIIEVVLTVITSPVWLLLMAGTALAIRLDSPGPVIFQQTRAGLEDHPFTIYKFRTMVVGADADGPQFTVKDDPRITKVGRFLRSTRLDEIPQLLNVLKGELALVGPRAEQVAFAEEFQRVIPFYRYRHLVRPGITGWAQVNSGYADDLEDTIEKLTYDLYYVRHMSPWLDINVLWRSAQTVVSGKGAQ